MKKKNSTIVEIILWVGLAIYIAFNISMNISSHTDAVMHVVFGVIYLAMIFGVVYTNKHILIPRYLQKNKTSQYIISFTLLILGLFIINAFALQKILSDIFCNIPGKILNRNIPVICINVLFKDFAIVALFSMLHVYEHLSITIKKKEKLFAEETGIVSITQKNNKLQILYTHDISYVQSRRNVLTLNMVNGQTMSQYSSLVEMEDTLGESKCLRINKNTLVLYSNIESYTTQEVFMKGRDEGLPFYLQNRTEIFEKLYQWDSGKFSEEKMKKLPKKEDLAELNTVSKDEIEAFGRIKNEILEESNDQNLSTEKSNLVYDFISQKPGCKTPLIADKTGISVRTVGRILKQLKDEDKIFYAGSKRIGGYRVKNKP